MKITPKVWVSQQQPVTRQVLLCTFMCPGVRPRSRKKAGSCIVGPQSEIRGWLSVWYKGMAFAEGLSAPNLKRETNLHLEACAASSNWTKSDQCFEKPHYSAVQGKQSAFGLPRETPANQGSYSGCWMNYSVFWFKSPAADRTLWICWVRCEVLQWWKWCPEPWHVIFGC